MCAHVLIRITVIYNVTAGRGWNLADSISYSSDYNHEHQRATQTFCISCHLGFQVQSTPLRIEQRPRSSSGSATVWALTLKSLGVAAPEFSCWDQSTGVCAGVHGTEAQGKLSGSLELPRLLDSCYRCSSAPRRACVDLPCSCRKPRNWGRAVPSPLGLTWRMKYYGFAVLKSQLVPWPQPVCSHPRATTHSDLILRATSLGIPYRVIHNASILNAVGCCGLQVTTEEVVFKKTCHFSTIIIFHGL